MLLLFRHGPRNCSAAVALIVWVSLAPVRGQELAPYGSMAKAEVTPTPLAPATYGARNSNWQAEPPDDFVHRSPLARRFTLPWHPGHRDPDDPARHVGLGYPLAGTSWRNRPVHLGWLFGGINGDDLIGGQIGQAEDILGGYRLGWDFDHYWGSELRFAFANLELTDLQAAGNKLGTSRNHFWDLHLLYYPWGDARWRPYFTLGAGLASFYFQDTNGQSVNETLLSLPFGLGVKYYWDNWLAVRCGLMDNLSFGSQGLSTMHNISLTCGVEIHFGRPPRSYYPYHPGGYLH